MQTYNYRGNYKGYYIFKRWEDGMFVIRDIDIDFPTKAACIAYIKGLIDRQKAKEK
jgi:hypothetical protein